MGLAGDVARMAKETQPPSWDDVEVGDIVEFTVRGRLHSKYIDGHPVVGIQRIGETGSTFFHAPSHSEMTTLKSVEKPVRTFKPGDVVRWKGGPAEIYTLAEGRYFSHQYRNWCSSLPEDDEPIVFTSADYELVD